MSLKTILNAAQTLIIQLHHCLYLSSLNPLVTAEAAKLPTAHAQYLSVAAPRGTDLAMSGPSSGMPVSLSLRLLDNSQGGDVY